MNKQENLKWKAKLVEHRYSLKGCYHYHSLRYHVEQHSLITKEEDWMTRKTKKGIVGKETPTLSQRYEVGEGIAFKRNNLKSTKEINAALEGSEKE